MTAVGKMQQRLERIERDLRFLRDQHYRVNDHALRRDIECRISQLQNEQANLNEQLERNYAT